MGREIRPASRLSREIGKANLIADDTDDCDRKAGVEMDIPGVESYKAFGIIVGDRGEGAPSSFCSRLSQRTARAPEP